MHVLCTFHGRLTRKCRLEASFLAGKGVSEQLDEATLDLHKRSWLLGCADVSRSWLVNDAI
jgi:hypothetical protein